ncbi:hypothetical protein HXA34_13495 [Salipaludibacillus agaradhaerens]|uniref:UPF0738 family protein n=1 Tax=Salipaludibacillus agaradhaerens TaxID=76935 RepID=UPI002150DFB0|nr:hypothetical protein [Salipaludibacillus agaradhaerens]MCR6107314.1 hypothetical protein [Salipaludibacillus agaradhaerens]MCR6119343.1 hypothetical protein [Salipaludibacillus agaradhaerens]
MIILNVISINAVSHKVVLTVRGDVSEEEWGSFEAGERMLVDSDNLAFVYLMETADNYHHVRIKEDYWAALKQHLKLEAPVELQLEDKEQRKIELTYFWGELGLLLENIQGNHNYGKVFVERVEEIFNDT